MELEPNEKIDILKTVYVDIQRDIKERKDREYKIVMTVAGAFLGVAWYIIKEGFYIDPFIQIIFCLLILFLAEVAIMWLHQSSKRIAGRRKTISKIDKAFGFFNPGAYGIGEQIYPDNKQGAPTKPNWTTRLYLMVLIISTISLCTTILLVKPTNTKDSSIEKHKISDQVIYNKPTSNGELIEKEIPFQSIVITIIFLILYINLILYYIFRSAKWFRKWHKGKKENPNSKYTKCYDEVYKWLIK